MMLDVFRGDAFSFTKLLTAINKIPYVPTKIGGLKWFEDAPVSTLTVAIEMQGGVLTLVQSQPRGTRGAAKNPERRNVRDFRPVHLPQSVVVLADEVQGLRSFGSETDEETAMGLLGQKFAVARRDLDLTHEYQRMGCIKGTVLDADGSVIYNYFNEFNVTQQTQAWALSTSTTKVLQLCMTLKRMIEDKLGGVQNSGVTVLCSPEFMDAFTGHPAVQAAWTIYQNSIKLQADYRGGFSFGDITWIEYRGQVGATRFIAANKAYAVPTGVPELFKSVWAPANYMETVNTLGLPFYTKSEDMKFGIGIEWEVQSNPLHICTRPDAIVELTSS